jgi:cytoskeleton protein RodZ
MKEAPLHEVQASPGEMLKALREERKLTVQDIAAKLYLDAGIIEALEQNKFVDLTASTYTRGYLRSYSRLVGADADLIIAIYNKVAPGPPEIIPEVRPPAQISSRDKPVQAFTWVVLLVIGLLVFSWVRSNYLVDEPDQPAEAAQTTAPAVPQPIPATAAIATDLLADVAPEEIENEFTDTVISPDHSPIPAAGGDLTELVEAGVNAALTETAADATTQAAAIDGGVAGAADNAAIAQGPDLLKLRFTADSWVEVTDRDGHRLYENLARTGDQISLSGAAPFAVKLGFSQGVILEFNGEPFDPAPYSHSGVASFTLE